jgi:hypothetical protein
MLTQDFFLPGLHRDFTSFPDHVAWDIRSLRRGSPLGRANDPLGASGSIGIAARNEAADGEDQETVAKNDVAERKGDETLRATLKWKI